MASTCTNQICAQFRIQHKNVTLKCLDLQKELDALRRAQADDFNQAVAQRTLTPMRDTATGEAGLLMRNGEIMTPDKITKRMEMAAKCLETLQNSEKVNRQLVEENKALKQTYEMAYAEMRRLEKILSGFEKPRQYTTFTDERHRETLALNQKLADELEEAERRLHALEEENDMLRRHYHRSTITAARSAIVEDEDGVRSPAAYITSDGRIPSQCPCDPKRCAQEYEDMVIGSESPTDAFADHMDRLHKCAHCKQYVADAKRAHELACSKRPPDIRIPKKKKARVLEDDDA